MAEVLGLVASGLSVAQVTGSIVSNTLKLKALLDEVKDAPESLRDTLDRLEILTPILSEFTEDDSDIKTTPLPSRPSPSPHLQLGLQRAFAACRKAAEQLELLVSDLKSEIDGARGGMRRNWAMFKVVLKKSAFAKYEARLEKTIQHLTLVQNTCIYAMQKRQPEIIVSLFALAQSPQSAHGQSKLPGHQAQSNFQASTEMPDRRASTKQALGPLRNFWQCGIAEVTGLVRIQTPSKHEHRQSQNSEHETLLRIQVHMPTWLGAKVFDAALLRTFTGWDYSLNVSGHILQFSDEFNLTINAIFKDNLDGLRRLFQERRCGPLDHLVSTQSWQTSDLTILEWALAYDAWQVAEHLLSHGAAHPAASRFLNARITATKIQTQPHLERILEHDALSDKVRLDCLACCPGGVDSFTSLVGRVLPAGDFYGAGFEDQRLDLATRIVQDFGRMKPVPSPAIFRHLCGSLALEDADVFSTTFASQCLAAGLSQTMWHDSVFGGDWHGAIRDAALRLNRVFLMPEKQLECGSFSRDHSSMLFEKGTPFTDLFLESMVSLPGKNGDPKWARQHKITHRLANCETALHAWLEIIRDCGIDLLEYGNQTKRVLRELGGDYNFNIWRDVWGERGWTRIPNGLFEVRLISFNYGSQPGDWKLWWSEPTDELVGNFWREMDPEPLWIPGSWVED